MEQLTVKKFLLKKFPTNKYMDCPVPKHHWEVIQEYAEAYYESLKSEPPNEPSIQEEGIKKDDPIINHIRNVKLLQAIHKGKRFFVECYPTDIGAKSFPNTNFAVKEIELPNFDLYEEKMGYKWQKTQP